MSIGEKKDFFIPLYTPVCAPLYHGFPGMSNYVSFTKVLLKKIGNSIRRRNRRDITVMSVPKSTHFASSFLNTLLNTFSKKSRSCYAARWWEKPGKHSQNRHFPGLQSLFHWCQMVILAVFHQKFGRTEEIHLLIPDHPPNQSFLLPLWRAVSGCVPIFKACRQYVPLWQFWGLLGRFKEYRFSSLCKKLWVEKCAG